MRDFDEAGAEPSRRDLVQLEQLMESKGDSDFNALRSWPRWMSRLAKLEDLFLGGHDLVNDRRLTTIEAEVAALRNASSAIDATSDAKRPQR
jgi:hypothetical protein